MSKVSVVLPTYNRAHLVGEAIDSVLSQTFKDFELIVIDDGSTDNTEELIDAIKDPRLKYIKQANGGVSSARNTGIKASNGEFIAFLDSDDLYVPQKLAIQMAKMTSTPEAGLVYSPHYLVNAQGSRKVAGMCHTQLGLRQLLLGPGFAWPTVLIRRVWLDQEQGFDEQFQIGEEWELTLRLALAGCQMVCTPEPSSIIRIQPISLSRELWQHQTKATMILDKIFEDPRMPSSFLYLQEIARATQLVRLAASAYLGAKPEIGREIFEKGLATTDTTKNSENLNYLFSRLVSFIVGLSVENPQKTLREVSKYLPGEGSLRKSYKHCLWGEFYLESAFKAHKLNQRFKCIANVLQALKQKPSYIRNRGLVSIFLRSLLGNWTIEGPKLAWTIVEKSK